MNRIKLILIAIFSIVVLTLVVVGAFSIKNKFSPAEYSFNMSSTTVIKELRDLNRLETASFTIEKIIDAGTSGNVFQEFLYGDRILLIAHGEVIAGIDLSMLSENDVKISEKSIDLTLPAPQILITTLDNAQTRVYDRKQGVLAKGNKDLESEARVKAQEAITKAACSGNILTEASENARKQLTALLRVFGFTSISITIPQGSC